MSALTGVLCNLAEFGWSCQAFELMHFARCRPLDVTWPIVPEGLEDLVEPFTLLKFFAVVGDPAPSQVRLLSDWTSVRFFQVYAYLPWVPATWRITV